MNQIKIVLAFALVFLLFGCTQGNVFQLGSPFTAEQGVTYFNSDLNISVQVVSFADSRCPANVQCVWAGEEGVNVLITRPGVNERAIKLGDGTIYLGSTTNKKATFSVLEKTLEISIVSINVDKNYVQLLVKEITQGACTEEALVCPDGSAVGRVGPNCRFSPCPNCVCPNGFIQEGAACNPTCYYETPGCLAASVECTQTK